MPPCHKWNHSYWVICIVEYFVSLYIYAGIFVKISISNYYVENFDTVGKVGIEQ